MMSSDWEAYFDKNALFISKHLYGFSIEKELKKLLYYASELTHESLLNEYEIASKRISDIDKYKILRCELLLRLERTKP